MDFRACIILYTDNQSLTDEKVVADVSAQVAYPVVSVKATSDANLSIAIQEAMDEKFSHVLIMNADGQYLDSEIPKLMTAAHENPYEVIIGKRPVVNPVTAKTGAIAKLFYKFWGLFKKGSMVFDAQTGMRVYPLIHLHNLQMQFLKRDFDIEVLIRLLWKGVHVREVEITIAQPPNIRRLRRFQKLKDKIRLSFLNGTLLVLTVLNSRGSPIRSSLALGFGVLIGCTPFYGFHTLLAALFSVLFRLNIVYLLFGSLISIPPVAPVMIWASMVIGNRIFHPQRTTIPTKLSWSHFSQMSFHDLLVFAQVHFKQWLVGSLVLGSILGFIVALTILTLNLRMQRRQKRDQPELAN